MKFIFLSLVVFLIIFTNCQKDDLAIEDGKYSGYFSVTYGTIKQTAPTTIEFNGNEYRCAGNPDRFPAGGSGLFSVSGQKIIFVDSNIWTADFDWNLILNGEYNYTYDGKILKIFGEKNNAGNYEYILKKE